MTNEPAAVSLTHGGPDLARLGGWTVALLAVAVLDCARAVQSR